MTDMPAKLGKIFIGGLSYETTDDKLRQYFGAYGPVTDAVVMKDPISRRSRGFGFITYSDPGCVDRALAQPNHILDSRRVEAKRAVPRADSTRQDIGSTSSSVISSTNSATQSSANTINSNNSSLSSSSLNGVGSSGSYHLGRSSSGNYHSSNKASSSSSSAATKKIFVGGLHYETKDAEFKQYFDQYGKVVSAEVMFNRETNKSRGFGFVVFEAENSVELVLQDKNHIIDAKAVEVKRAVPRTDAPPPNKGAQGGVTSYSRTPGNSNSTVSTSSIGRSIHSIGSKTTVHGEDDKQIPPSRPFATVAKGSLGGYAAAVRYGGKGAPPVPTKAASKLYFDQEEPCDCTSSVSSTNYVVEDMEKVSLGDEPSSGGGVYHGHDQPETTFSSPQQDFGSTLNRIGSPKSAVLSPTSPPLSAIANANAWSTNPNPTESPLSQYPQYEPSGLLNHHQSQSSTSPRFQWNQSQWGSASASTHNWGKPDIPSSQPPLPVGGSTQFFSMFGAPTMNDHHPSNSTSGSRGYRQGPWDDAPSDGGYSGNGLGMSGFSSSIGVGMQGMRLNPDMSRLNMPPPQDAYGGFGSASLGSFGNEDSHSSIGALANPNLANTRKGSTRETSGATKSDEQQLNYGSYPNSQFPTYR